MTPAESPSLGRTALAAVLAVAFLCYFLPFDQPGFEQSDELFYLVGGMTANETGDFLVPAYQGHVRFQKPPLNYWLIAASYRVFGVGAWQGRLPSVLAGVASVWLTWRLGLLLFASRRAALYAACALASCHLALDQAHLATTDGVLALFVLGSFFGFGSSLRDRSWWGLPLAWASMGAAMLQKGPVWALIPVTTVSLWMLVSGRKTGATWRQVFAPVPLVLFAALVVPWPLLVLKRLAESAVMPTVSNELRKHLVPNPLEWPVGLASALSRMFLGFLPWSLLCVHYRERESRTPAVRLLALWGLGVGLFFGVLMVLHRSRYFVPLAPAIALLCGRALAELQLRSGQGARLGRWFAALVDLSFPAAALVSGLLAATSATLVDNPASTAVAWVGVGAAAVSFFVVRRLRARNPQGTAWVAAAASALAVAQVLSQFAWPATYLATPAYGLAKERLRPLPAGASIAGVGLDKGERGWAWLGAGRSFPQFGALEPADPPIAWPEVAKARFLLLPGERAAAMPAPLRAAYTPVASRTATTFPLHPLWFFDKEGVTRAWRQSGRTFVLLRRDD